jgi:hypothetical protein
MPVGITALRLREAAEKLARRYEPESYETYASARAQSGLPRSAAPPPPPSELQTCLRDAEEVRFVSQVRH